MTGKVVSHYRIAEKLGEGGMGVVYKAEDTKLRRTVALKVLRSELVEDRARFLREAEAIASLNHPNVCTVFEVDDEHSFIAMEFVEGKTLKQKIAPRPLAVEEAIDIAGQCCDGLRHAHEKGVVHRDIKPANIMLTADGRVKIMDFGLAQMADRTRITKEGATAGTPAYMSPEQVNGKPADRRTDLWSLSVVLYEMLAGSSPFTGENEHAICYGIVQSEPQPVTALRSGLPKGLDRVLAKGLAKSPDDRYQTAADLGVDIRGAADSAPVIRMPGRARRVAAFAAAAFLAVAAYFAIIRRETAPPIRSIAILPLRALAQEAQESYLGFGIADALITKIGQTGQLQVRPLSSVRKYAKGDHDALDVAKQLSVEAILDGTMQVAGGKLRVSVHLIRSGSGETIWTQSFDVPNGDVLTVQDNLAKQVAGQLRLQLDDIQRRRFEKRQTSDSAAFELYSKGIFHFDNRYTSVTELDLAIDLFQRAVDRDPAYAMARAYLGYACAWRTSVYKGDARLLALARRELAEAEKIDPGISQIHIARAFLHWSQEEGWKMREGLVELRLATQLDPNTSRTDLAAYFYHLGLERLAEKNFLLALSQEPQSESVKSAYIGFLYRTHRYDDAIKEEQRLLQRTPRREYYFAKGMLDEAERLIQRDIAMGVSNLDLRVDRARLFAHQGKAAAARKELTSVEREAEQRPRVNAFHHTSYRIAQVRALLGDAKEALHWLRITIESGTLDYPAMDRDPMLKPVRNDPEIARLLATVKTSWEGFQREFDKDE